jgi:hypothetical protein
MNEIDVKLFESFEQYLSDKGYKIKHIADESIRGVKNDTVFHFYFDSRYDEYCMYISIDGLKKWATMFLQGENGTFDLNHSNDKRKFDNINEVIQFTLENSSK